LQDRCTGGQCTSPTMNCPNNQRCEGNGNNVRCAPTCTSECTPGDRRCKPNDSLTVQLCIRNQTCGVWQDEFGCTLGTVGDPVFRCMNQGNSASCVCTANCL
jgi:hypothetical protein